MSDRTNPATSLHHQDSLAGHASPSFDRTRTYNPASDSTGGESPAPCHASIRPDEILADRYRVVSSLGEGGMGSVYLAEQIEPVQRHVAVKLIRSGLSSAAVLARFDAERQALALMDHPSIAKVFDGGTLHDGRPFFVMEYVVGRRLTAYCDQNRLNVRERLALLAQVCRAVHHAHQKGVIHRDLKPSNILVAESDGKPLPKVIDFGIAKATTQRLTDHPADTAIGLPGGRRCDGGASGAGRPRTAQGRRERAPSDSRGGSRDGAAQAG